MLLFLLSEAKYKAKYREGLKMLSPKQMLQRLPIALALIKADDNSQSLLNQTNCLFIVSIKGKY